MMEGLIGSLKGALSGLIGGGISVGPELLDVILLGGIGMGVVRGYLRGGLQLASSMGGTIAGIWAGVNYATTGAQIIESYVSLPSAFRAEIGFIAVLVVTRLLVQVGGRGLGEILETVGFGVLNKGLGALIGGYKVALLASLLLIAGGKLDLPTSQTRMQSQWYQTIYKVLPATWNAAQTIAPGIGLLKNAPMTLLNEAKSQVQGLRPQAGTLSSSKRLGGRMRVRGSYQKPFSKGAERKKNRRASAEPSSSNNLVDQLTDTVASLLQGTEPLRQAYRSRKGTSLQE
jgi:Uncharacterized membrane protein, required for colicin V production